MYKTRGETVKYSGSGLFLPILFRSVMVGIASGFILALFAVSWIWLDMRMNAGLIIPASAFLFSLFALWRRRLFSYRLFLLLQGLMMAAFLSVYGFDAAALRTTAAFLFREGFLWKTLRLETAVLLAGGIFFTGNLLWICVPFLRPPKRSKYE